MRGESEGPGKPIILLWSARYDFENGQAIVTRRVVEHQAGVEWMSAVYEPGRGLALIAAALSAIRALFLVLFRRPDAVYAVCARSTMGFLRDAPVLFTALLGIRVVVHVHGSDLPDLLERPSVGVFARLLYRRCDIIVPSAHLIPVLTGLHCKRLVLCENFMGESAGRVSLPRYHHGMIKLLWNSNLMASKGLRECIEGARRARATGVNLRLTLLGEPTADEELSARAVAEFAQGLRHEDWIDVVGKVSAETARDVILEHDAVLLPSRYASECQPLAIIEAMAAAREIVVRDTAALRTTVGDYPAIFVAGDAESIAAAIETLVANAPARAEGLLSGARGARKRFSPARFDREMHAILTASI